MPEIDQQSEQPNSESKPLVANEQVPRKRGKRIGICFVILLVLIAIASTAYLGYRLELTFIPRQLASQQQLDVAIADIGAMRSKVESQVEILESQQQQLDLLLQQQTQQAAQMNALASRSDEKLTEKIDAVTESVSAIYQKIDRQADDWRLGDLAFLLSLGEKQLQLTRNPAVALSVWQTVEQQLRRLADPQLLIVRTQVSEEIRLLEAIESVDVNAISSRLLDLVEQADALPVAKAMEQRLSDIDSDQTTADEVTSDGTWGSLWADLKSLVRVQKIEDSATLPLTPVLKNYWVEHIKVSLLGAQIAVVQGDSEVYQANLSYVRSALDKHFDAQAVSVAKFSQTLGSLIELPVVASLPAVDKSYRMLQEILVSTRSE